LYSVPKHAQVLTLALHEWKIPANGRENEEQSKAMIHDKNKFGYVQAFTSKNKNIYIYG
jgi:hypothetical protein